MIDRIYMDNSATSFPKPEAVTRAMVDFATRCGASAGRGAYAEAKACEAMIAQCRARVAKLINAESPERIVFTMNCSEGLSIAVRGLLNTADLPCNAVATAMEHNSVLRPLNALAHQREGFTPRYVPCDSQTGLVDVDDIRRAIDSETRLVACVHVSNVTGTLQPIEQVAEVAREAAVPLVVDAAQSVGHVAIDVQALGADMVVFPGHKGLLGPLGTGVLYVRPGVEDILPTMKEGGTGTISEQALQPATMPDKYEIGSHNAIGLAGLNEAMKWVLHKSVDALARHDRKLCELFLEMALGKPGLTIYGPLDVRFRTGVFSVSIEGLAPGELAGILERDYGICTRPGIHCAPLAHETIGTHPIGTCRLSFGAFTTDEHVQRAVEALTTIAHKSV